MASCLWLAASRSKTAHFAHSSYVHDCKQKNWTRQSDDSAHTLLLCRLFCLAPRRPRVLLQLDRFLSPFSMLLFLFDAPISGHFPPLDRLDRFRSRSLLLLFSPPRFLAPLLGCRTAPPRRARGAGARWAPAPSRHGLAPSSLPGGRGSLQVGSRARPAAVPTCRICFRGRHACAFGALPRFSRARGSASRAAEARCGLDRRSASCGCVRAPRRRWLLRVHRSVPRRARPSIVVSRLAASRSRARFRDVRARPRPSAPRHPRHSHPLPTQALWRPRVAPAARAATPGVSRPGARFLFRDARAFPDAASQVRRARH